MIAIDTNVLIYPSDQADQRRQKIALDLIPTRPHSQTLKPPSGCEIRYTA